MLPVPKVEKQPETNTVIQKTESRLGPVAHKASVDASQFLPIRVQELFTIFTYPVYNFKSQEEERAGQECYNF